MANKKRYLIICAVVLVGILLVAFLKLSTDKRSSSSSSKMTNNSASAKKTVNRLRVATFNVSMEARQYKKLTGSVSGIDKNALSKALLSNQGKAYQQIQNITTIINAAAPDIILLNEFDHTETLEQDIQLLKKKLNNRFPFHFVAPVNTGIISGYDLNRDGSLATANDAWGFGEFPGHFGMLLLSRYPVNDVLTRTFQNFKWKDMPEARQPKTSEGDSWYSHAAWEKFPLSSKSHWDVAIEVNDKVIHIVAAHPTPPVFDGDEDRNGKRNADEIRFIDDYISADNKLSTYIYDDQGRAGGLATDAPFVILGDLNASPWEGQADRVAINSLLSNPRLNDCLPASKGGEQNRTDSQYAKYDTAEWGLRVDYVLASSNLKLLDCQVFWPDQQQAHANIMNKRELSSDHRLVWADIEF
jgi:endonuclease/exonuclease/phosphatase family metal-dependent hydrolase